MRYTLIKLRSKVKGARRMEWIDRLNRAMDYIEGHLEEPDWQTAAGIAHCSPYHFQRMFTLLAGMPLSEYVRRRRMSRAAVELQGGAKILDVACMYRAMRSVSSQ